MSLTVGKTPIESVYQVEQKRSEGTDASVVKKNIVYRKLAECLTIFTADLPKVTSYNQVREQATVATVAINKSSVFEHSNNETKTNLIASTEKPQKNVTSSGIGTVAKRFGTGKDKKEDPVNNFLSNPDDAKWKELVSMDIQDVFGGKC